MTTEHDLDITELSLDLDGTLGTHTINNETVWHGCRLEPLLSAPYRIVALGEPPM